MNLSSSVARNACLWLLLILGGRFVCGSTAVVRLDSVAVPPVVVHSYAGKIEAQVVPIKASTALNVVLLVDNLSPEAADATTQELLDLAVALHGRPFRLATIRGGEFEISTAITSRARLKVLLEKALSPTEAVPNFAASTAPIDSLIENAAKLGSGWSRLLVIGELPTLDAATTEYAAARLSNAFGNQHVQVTWSATQTGSLWGPAFHAAGQGLQLGTESDFAAAAVANALVQVEWITPAPSAGFVVYRASLADEAGAAQLPLLELSAAPGVTLPNIEKYAASQAGITEAENGLKLAAIDSALFAKLRGQLQSALEVNARDLRALVAAAALYERSKDYKTAIDLCNWLVEVRPTEADAHVALGHALLLAGEFDRSEPELKRAADIGGMKSPLAEDFAHLSLARHDDKNAIDYLDQVLQAEPNRQDVWFLRAQSAERLHDAQRAVQSYENGLAIGGIHVAETGSLLRLYVAGGQQGKATELARVTVSRLPAESSTRTEFAAMLDDTIPAEALPAWHRVLEVQPTSERAHYRIARLLLESGDGVAAEQAADTGLATVPASAQLFIVKADALEKQHRTYAARRVLQEAAESVTDQVLLARLAAAEDTYATAAGTYERLAEAQEKSSPERLVALERGFAVSLRDGDLKHAQTFSHELEAAGHSEFRSLLPSEQQDSAGIVIPGGLDALAYVAGMREGLPPETFMEQYCRSIFNDGSAKHIAAIREHLQRISALEAFGKRDRGRIVITLSLNSKESRKTTERVLGILGLSLHSAKGETSVARGEKKNQTGRQETASALVLDEVAMQKAFQDGKPFQFEIPFETAYVHPDVSTWREYLSPGDNEAGGLAATMLRMPKLARLYVGLSSLDGKSITELLSAVSLHTLVDKYADLMFSFAPAFAIENGHAAVPGGRPAEKTWLHMASASPDKPDVFFRALLERDDGKLLAFFFALSQLDARHQAFFTANDVRTTRFYKAFAATDEAQHHSVLGSRDSAVSQMLRAVPLDKDVHVAFPGSPEVWVVAKGRSGSEMHTSKLMKKVANAASPDVEDEVLLRLADTHYKGNTGQQITELDNFLAVARIDAHRTEHLDEETALLLAQNFTDFSDAYPYFTDLTGLETADFRQFFAAVEHIKQHSEMNANLQLGQLHSLIEWLCLLNRRGVIDESNAAKLFRSLVDRFASAETASSYTRASLDSVREVMSHINSNTEQPDERLRSGLLGSTSSGSPRAVDFRRVLEMQKVPTLGAVLSIYEALGRMSTHGASPSDLEAINKSVESFASVEVPKALKVGGKEKEGIVGYDPADVKKAFAELKQHSNRQKAKDLAKYAEQLLGELQPTVTAALAGPVYAFFMRSTDLVISDDPLLLRKHRYFEFASSSEHNLKIRESKFVTSSEKAGSYFLGGFAQFALASGSAAAVSWGSAGPSAMYAIGAQIGATRGTSWDQLEESDQRLVALRIQAAREWICEAARSSKQLEAISEETLGLLSLSRRAELLNGIETRSWRRVWDSVTLPELFALGGKYLEHYKTDPWSSPVMTALRMAVSANRGLRLLTLGPIPYHSYGCSHPHLVSDAPYEEYERHFLVYAIAERAAEFDLFLTFQADAAGTDPAQLLSVAEPLAAKAFRNAHMSDFHDWRSLLAAYGTIKPNDVKKALEQ